MGDTESGTVNGQPRVHTDRLMWGKEGAPRRMPLRWGVVLWGNSRVEIYDVLLEACRWMIVALCIWDIPVGPAQRTTNTRALSYHWEIHFLAALLYFPLPRADAGGLLFEKGIGASWVCLKLFFIKVSLLTYSPPSVWRAKFKVVCWIL